MKTDSDAVARPPRLRFAELYCGIGGCAAAVAGIAEIVCAVDINQSAGHIYRANFPHTCLSASLESLPLDTWQRWEADLWWLSPPCQPFSVRGLRRDLDDPRAASFRIVMQRIGELLPRYLALENVPGFVHSRAHLLLRETLSAAGYQVHEHVFCPTQYGAPNRRRRFFLVAARPPLLRAELPPTPKVRRPLADYLDQPAESQLWVPEAVLEAYRGALHIVDLRDDTAETHCFTSAYGRSPVRSGSYLRTADGVRRFSPREILRMLGFPDDFRLPAEWPASQLWPLVGNSLSLVAVRAVLATIPELASLSSPYSSRSA